ncbi:MAG: FHA domain-containing protein [Gemmatimonadota bacterium]
MEQLTLVELSDASGVVTARVQVKSGAITVGRAPENLVHLEDEFVDAQHLVVEWAPDGGALTVQDLGTTNGTRVEGRVHSGETLRVDPNQAVTVGQTTIRFRRVATDVPEAKVLPDTQEDDRLFAYERLPSWRLVAALTLYIGGVFTFTSHDLSGWAEITGVTFVLFLFVLMWAGVWAGGTKIFTGHGRFRAYLGVTSALGLVFFPIGAVAGWINFAAGDSWIRDVVQWGVLGLGMWTFSLFLYIDIASRRSRGLKMTIAVACAALALAAGWGLERIEVAPADQIRRSMSMVAPVPPSLTRSRSLDDLIEELGDVKSDVDSAEVSGS